jgi:D-aspartate ligase
MTAAPGIPFPAAPRTLEPALILGDDPINTLGVARNLGRAGVPVSRLGSADGGVLESRYIRSTHVVPGIDERSGRAYVAALEDVGRKLGGRPVLFPITDLHVLKISSNADALAQRFRLLAAGREATETLVNKRLFHESLERAGVPAPATRFPRGREQFREAARQIGFPVLLKPEVSPLFARKFQRKGFVAHDEAELGRYLDLLEPSGLDVMIQEIIPGDARCMHGCAGFRTDAATLHFCYRRVREFPPGFGCGSLLESVPSFFASTRLGEYLGGLRYTGIFDAEFKLDPRDGVFKSIEINARSWWQNMHPTISGLNLIKAAYDHATGGSSTPPGYRSGTKWIHLYNDFFAARTSGLALLPWLRSMRGDRAFDLWALDDARPMLSFLGVLVGRRLGKLLRGGEAGR